MRRLSPIALFALLAALAPALAAEPVSAPAAPVWRFALGDESERTEPGFDDSGWESVDAASMKELPESGSWFWLRAEIRVPEELRGDGLYLVTGKATGPMDVYAGGQYIGRRGGLPPAYFHRPLLSDTMVIPAAAVGADGTLTLALRCYYLGTMAPIPSMQVANREVAERVRYLQNFLNGQLYVILAALCLFLGVYFAFQFAARPDDRSNLFYALSLIFVSVYFYDMGAERYVPSSLVFRALARACLTFSLGFLMRFYARFFGYLDGKLLAVLVWIDMAAFGIAHVLASGDDTSITAVFNVSLLPIFIAIFIGVVILVRAVRRGNPDAIPVLIGQGVGIAFGIHDIIYQVLGKDPYAWLQGFTFFALNVSVFISLALRSSRNQGRLERYMRETEEQKDRLQGFASSIDRSIPVLAELSLSLDAAVGAVSEASARSAESSSRIERSVGEQGALVGRTGTALEGLVGSIAAVGAELEVQSENIGSNAATIERVSGSIERISLETKEAAARTENLDALTNEGEKGVRSLAAVMAAIGEASKEINGIVDAVNDVAERTNLLAMNASIEAAHAGAAGRGFGVIAGEIKKLASASTERSLKIKAIVDDVAAKIRAGTDTAEGVGSSLGTISRETDRVVQLVRNISDSIEEQRVSTVSLSDSLAKLRGSAEAVRKETGRQAEFSEGVRAASGGLGERTDAVRASALEIAERTERLVGEVRRLSEAAGKARAVIDELKALAAR